MSDRPQPPSSALALAQRLEKAPDDAQARALLAALQLDRGQNRAAAALMDGLPAGVDPPPAFAVLRQRLSQAPAAAGPAHIAEEGPSCRTCLTVFGLTLLLVVVSGLLGTAGGTLPALEEARARADRVSALGSESFRARADAARWLKQHGTEEQRKISYLAPRIALVRCQHEDDALEGIELVAALGKKNRSSKEQGAEFATALNHRSEAVQERALKALRVGDYRLAPNDWAALIRFVGRHRPRWAELIPLLDRRLPTRRSGPELSRFLRLLAEAIDGDDPAARIVALRRVALAKGAEDPEWAEKVARLAMDSGDSAAVKAGVDLGLRFPLDAAVTRYLADIRAGIRTGGGWKVRRKDRRASRLALPLRKLGFTQLRDLHDAEANPFAKEVLEHALSKTPGGLGYLVGVGTWTPTGKRVADATPKRKRAGRSRR